MGRAGIRAFFLVVLLAGHSVRADRSTKRGERCLGVEKESDNRNAVLNSRTRVEEAQDRGSCGFKAEDIPNLKGFLEKLTHVGAGAQGEVCTGPVSKKPPTAPKGNKYRIGRFTVTPRPRWTPKVNDVVAVKGSCTDNDEADNGVNEMVTEAYIMTYLRMLPQVAQVWKLTTSSGPVGACKKKMAFFAMQGIFGGDLNKFLRDASVTPQTSAKLFFDAYWGMQDMHRHGILHRDLKPANIMKVEGKDKTKIIDFGSACCFNSICKQVLRSDSLSCKPELNGKGNTPYYMSPELFLGEGEPNITDDGWAMGLTAYQMFVHQDSKFFNWIFPGDNILSLARNVVNAAALQQRIETDERLQDYPNMKEFLKTTLLGDQSLRYKATIARLEPFCEDTAWCAEWMNMQAFPISEASPSQQDFEVLDARRRSDATQQSTPLDNLEKEYSETFDDINDRGGETQQSTPSGKFERTLGGTFDDINDRD